MSKLIWTPCASCDRETRHSILSAAGESDDYSTEVSYQIIECMGCETKSFLKSISYLSEAHQDHEDNWIVPKDVISYPSILKGHRTLRDIVKAPRIVREIYRESLDAIKGQSYTLAGIGLRATIEAICNERSITGKSLDVRIDRLAKGGFVSQADADRLHAIRFMGNDAAHEIQAAELGSLVIALKIIEHLIVSLYILDQDADGMLETLIKTYPEFERHLKQRIETLAVGDEFPLGKILGREVRRFHGYLRTHESALVANIASGAFIELKIGRLDHFAGSRDKMQHYIKI